jgi:hypothetical protein
VSGWTILEDSETETRPAISALCPRIRLQMLAERCEMRQGGFGRASRGGWRRGKSWLALGCRPSTRLNETNPTDCQSSGNISEECGRESNRMSRSHQSSSDMSSASSASSSAVIPLAKIPPFSFGSSGFISTIFGAVRRSVDSQRYVSGTRPVATPDKGSSPLTSEPPSP